MFSSFVCHLLPCTHGGIKRVVDAANIVADQVDIRTDWKSHWFIHNYWQSKYAAVLAIHLSEVMILQGQMCIEHVRLEKILTPSPTNVDYWRVFSWLGSPHYKRGKAVTWLVWMILIVWIQLNDIHNDVGNMTKNMEKIVIWYTHYSGALGFTSLLWKICAIPPSRSDVCRFQSPPSVLTPRRKNIKQDQYHKVHGQNRTTNIKKRYTNLTYGKKARPSAPGGWTSFAPKVNNYKYNTALHTLCTTPYTIPTVILSGTDR